MAETLIVVSALGALLALGWLGPLLPLEWLVWAGVGCTALGMLIGLPTGIAYHVKLYAALRRRGPLPGRWWLRPTALHRALEPAERPAVMGWFYAGGAGFALTALGCGLVILALALALLRLR